VTYFLGTNGGKEKGSMYRAQGEGTQACIFLSSRDKTLYCTRGHTFTNTVVVVVVAVLPFYTQYALHTQTIGQMYLLFTM